MEFIKKVITLQLFISHLSWKKIAQLATFVLLVFIMWLLFEGRNHILGYVSHTKISTDLPVVYTLSKKSADELETIVNKSDLIIAMQVTLTDFQKNSRHAIYTYTDNESLDRAYKDFIAKGLIYFPIFNSDTDNNKRIVELLNGEFVCTPFHNTIAAKSMFEVNQYISYQCSSGIPPSYGRFVGIVNIYTKRAPTVEEVDLLRAAAKNAALSVYENDFK